MRDQCKCGDDAFGGPAVAVQRVAALLREICDDGSVPPLIVESYVDGVEIAVEGLVREGVLEVIALLDKPDPLTGPFYVEGAMPGDTLVVHLTRVRLNRDSAFQSNAVAGNALTPAFLQSQPHSDGSPAEWRLDAGAGSGVLAKPTAHLRITKTTVRCTKASSTVSR